MHIFFSQLIEEWDERDTGLSNMVDNCFDWEYWWDNRDFLDMGNGIILDFLKAFGGDCLKMIT